MKTRFQRPPAGSKSKAFSLLEIMVAVSLLTVITLGLLAMFHQTQKAFRSSMTQTDVLETGRALQDMFAREIAQIAPGYASNYIRNPDRPNVFVEQPRAALIQPLPGQPLPGTANLRTNVLERFYLLTRANQQWKALDYQVVFDSANVFVGTLYRDETNSPITQVPAPRNWFFRSPQITANLTPNHHRLADGILHFRVRAYDTNGMLYAPTPQLRTDRRVGADLQTGDQTFRFWSNALPASLEVEFAMLETPALEQLRSLLGNPVAANRFLSNQVGRVHLFRQRVQLGNSASVVPP